MIYVHILYKELKSQEVKDLIAIYFCKYIHTYVLMRSSTHVDIGNGFELLRFSISAMIAILNSWTWNPLWITVHKYKTSVCKTARNGQLR